MKMPPRLRKERSISEAIYIEWAFAKGHFVVFVRYWEVFEPHMAIDAARHNRTDMMKVCWKYVPMDIRVNIIVENLPFDNVKFVTWAYSQRVDWGGITRAAIDNGSKKIVKYLTSNQDLKEKDDRLDSAFTKACMVGDIESIDLVLARKRCLLDCGTCTAAEAGHHETVEHLIRLGAVFKLHCSLNKAIAKGHVRVVEHLFPKIYPNPYDSELNIRFSGACNMGHKDLQRYFYDLGAQHCSSCGGSARSHFA